MASRVTQAGAIGNFKRSRADRLKEKGRDKRADRPGNCEKHLAAIRRLPCSIPGCNVIGCDAHHLRDTGERGGALKSPDKYTLPLCHITHHLEGVHTVGTKRELRWLKDRGIDGLELAASLWAASPNVEKMARIIIEHKRGGL